MDQLEFGAILNERPELYDGFGFFMNRETNKVQFYYFDDMARKHGKLPGNPDVPEDRESYHVLLTSVRKGIVHVEKPFTSCFIDPFVYATRIVRAGFNGIMIRETQYSLILLSTALLDTLKLFKTAGGFVMKDEDGVDVFHEGLNKGKKL